MDLDDDATEREAVDRVIFFVFGNGLEEGLRASSVETRGGKSPIERRPNLNEKNSAVLTAWLALAGGELVVGASEPFSELTAQLSSSTRSIWPVGYWPDGRHRSSRTRCVSSRHPCT